MDILIGADPELFLKKDGKFYSGHGLIPGTKIAPHRVDNGAVQVDGMALEFNIDPASTSDEFCININEVLNHLRNMVPEEYSFSLDATAEFSEEHMSIQPEEALALGCEPDFNAYTGQRNPPPKISSNMRTAAGHVHIGWTNDADVESEEHINGCINLVKQLDFTLGLPSIWEDRDKKRRKMYGQAGAFRPKPYGVEYRVLSNYWIKDNKTMQLIFNRTVRAIDFLKGGMRLEERYGSAEHAINKGLKKNAIDLAMAAGIY